MSNTAKFYTGVVVMLALIIAVSLFVGYRVGVAHVSSGRHASRVPAR